MKKSFITLSISVLSFLILAGCEIVSVQSPLTTETIQSEMKKNDFSELDRTLVSWPLTFDECVAQSGEVQTYSRGKQCLFGEIRFYDEDYINYHPDMRYAGILHQVMKHVSLSPTAQNHLIEFFAIAPEKWTSKTPHLSSSQGAQQENALIWSGTEDFGIIYQQGKYQFVRKNTDVFDMYELQNPNQETLQLVFNYSNEDETEIKLNPFSQEAFQQFLLANQQTTLQLIAIKNNSYRDETSDQYIEKFDKTVQGTLTVNHLVPEDVALDSEACLGETRCFYKDIPVWNYKERYVQFLVDEETAHNQGDDVIIYNQDLSLLLRFQSMGLDTIESDHFLRIQDENGVISTYETESHCTYEHIRFNFDGPRPQDVPDSLNILGEQYQISSLSFDEMVSFNSEIRQGNTLFANAQEAEQLFTEQALQEQVLPVTYLVRFQSHPNVWFHYHTEFPNGKSILIYHSDSEISTDSQGNLTDLATTKSLYCTYRGEPFEEKFLSGTCVDYPRKEKVYPGMLLFSDKERYDHTGEVQHGRNEGEIEERILFNEKLLPFFKVRPTTKEGWYFILPANNEITTDFLGEGGCKPVVYVYDHDPSENTLTVTLPKGDLFTKLVPLFTTGTSRIFTADTQSNIHVKNVDGTFPYLYYSTYWKHYEPNQYGRYVAYNDVEAFLKEKLTAMNLNSKEQSEFLEYWLPQFTPGYLYSISFKFNEQFEPYAHLSFARAPQAQFRMFMEAYQLPFTRTPTYSPKKEIGKTGIPSFSQRGTKCDVVERGGYLKVRKK